MEKDDLLKQLVDYANIAKSANPLMELDIKKSLDALKGMGSSQREIEALDKALHAPQTLAWKGMPPLPERPFDYHPTEQDIAFIKDLIQSGVKLWGVPVTARSPQEPQTALHYGIDHENKTFKVLVDCEHDEGRIHDKTKMILGLLGWTMIDFQDSTLSYSAVVGPWILAVFDFPIHTQIDSRTGKNYPEGTRGQDAVATGQSGKLMRLGPHVGAELIKHAKAKQPTYGNAKTDAPGKLLIKRYGTGNKDS